MQILGHNPKLYGKLQRKVGHMFMIQQRCSAKRTFVVDEVTHGVGTGSTKDKAMEVAARQVLSHFGVL